MALLVKPIKPKNISFWIVGTSPLIQHQWTEKALRMLKMSALERKKVPKEKRDPEADGMACAYTTDNGEFGIPVTAFKASLISAAHKDLGIEKTLVRKSFFVPCTDSGNVLPMDCDAPVIREDIVRVGANSTDVRYRPMFTRWGLQVFAQVDSDLLADQDIINLVNRAGFSVGIGEWRPEKGGEFGRFQFDADKPFEVIG